VRNLAMRAAEAAKTTASLIEDTVKTVKEGSELAGKTGGEFSEVSKNVSRLGELVGEIASASQEQAQGIEQVNKAVSEMDKVIQLNAANAEESASASEEMNAQAEQMREFVKELETMTRGAVRRKGNGGRQDSYGDRAAWKAEEISSIRVMHRRTPQRALPQNAGKKPGNGEKEWLIDGQGQTERARTIGSDRLITTKHDDFEDF
jgi:uncharacterized phage infection (PIP) family protein YhgE